MISIKLLNHPDFASWKTLWDGYLAFYQTTLSDDVTAKIWERLLDPQKDDQAVLGAFVDDALAGFVTICYHNGTWSLAPYCYLEDLFVSEKYRGQGIARQLIEGVYDHARNKGACQVYWATQEGNAPARKLYDQMAELTDFVKYKKALN